MNRIKAAIKALGMSYWFVKKSWCYVVTKKVVSKVFFFTWVIPAWIRFTFLTYKDYRKGKV